MATWLVSTLSSTPQNPSRALRTRLPDTPLFNLHVSFEAKKLSSSMSLLRSGSRDHLEPLRSISGRNLSEIPSKTGDYEFCDGSSEVELRIDIEVLEIQGSSDIFVDADENSLLVRAKSSGTLITLVQIDRLYEKIKPGETIWYIDEDQLVINLKKYYTDLKWPDIMESWKSLTSGVLPLLKGTSISIVGDSTEINQKVTQELAVGIGYTPLNTSELLERYAQQSIDSWVISEGVDSVAEAEGAVLESLSSHARTVVATLGGEHGAARRPDKWRHLHAGLTVWLSKSEAADEASAKEEARRHMQDGSLGYTNADAVVKLVGWDMDHAQAVSQACLSALKQLVLSDKLLLEKKSLYIRLGCRGDWPNIKPPGWDPSSCGVNPPPRTRGTTYDS